MQSQIVSIRKLDITETRYNLEVEDNNNYFANNILVHNCRCLVYKVGDTVTMMSRGNKEFKNLNHLKQLFVDMPTDVAFDGELYVDGYKFEVINSWITKNRPETKNLCFHAYDLIDLTNPSFKYRYEKLLRLLPQSDYIKVVNTVVVHDEEQIMQARDQYINDGYEGGMFRNAAGLYKPGHKSYDLLKLKVFEDAEFEIVGSYDGVGRAEGEINFVCKLPNGNTVDVPMMGDKETLKEMWLDREKYIGKMLTVQFQGWTDPAPPKLPCLRFPKGKGIRLMTDNGEVLY